MENKNYWMKPLAILGIMLVSTLMVIYTVSETVSSPKDGPQVNTVSAVNYDVDIDAALTQGTTDTPAPVAPAVKAEVKKKSGCDAKANCSGCSICPKALGLDNGKTGAKSSCGCGCGG